MNWLVQITKFKYAILSLCEIKICQCQQIRTLRPPCMASHLGVKYFNNRHKLIWKFLENKAVNMTFAVLMDYTVWGANKFLILNQIFKTTNTTLINIHQPMFSISFRSICLDILLHLTFTILLCCYLLPIYRVPYYLRCVNNHYLCEWFHCMV